MLHRFQLRSRVRAAGIHLLICAAAAMLAASLVFGVWFPGIYRLIAGGTGLFLLIAGVDVVLGPLLTFVVFDLGKGWPQLKRDLAIIGLIQVAALLYGLAATYQARPVAMVFEADRFRVIAAGQVYLPELDKARPEYQKLPLSGPWLLGTRAPAAGDESSNALFMALGGVDRAERPMFWQPYSMSTADALSRSRPLSVLLRRYPIHADEIEQKLRELRIDAGTAKFLPLIARRGDWVAILDNAGTPVYYQPLDGFF
jgi:hypothetical protein